MYVNDCLIKQKYAPNVFTLMLESPAFTVYPDEGLGADTRENRTERRKCNSVGGENMTMYYIALLQDALGRILTIMCLE